MGLLLKSERRTRSLRDQVHPSLLKQHRISPSAYAQIKRWLGRDPNLTELGIFSVMWSEHCSYCSSRPLLSLFPKGGPRVLVKAGAENAGAVDIGDGLAVIFKVESHNHPSAVEPYQGAATGVGGILRDIFTMGARPIALLDSLRFGDLKKPKVKRLFKGVVSGIAAYGNCFGCPTVGGEIYFDDSYEANPLVNVMCVGIVRHKDLIKGSAKGAGNPVFYVGAATGRDGLGGASFASRELEENSEKDRPAVQIADPFMEKLLLEACLELIQTGCVVGMQDMGAAGLTCSTCETASRGKMGIEIDLQKVPRREEGMTPYEVMLSESQERMLVIVKKGREKEAGRVFSKWDLHAVQIGKVVEGDRMRVWEGPRLCAEIPVRALTDEAPVVHRPAKEPVYLQQKRVLPMVTLPEPKDYTETLMTLLTTPTLANKAWVYEQYDHMVQINSVVTPGIGTSILRIKGTKKFLAVTTDGNGTYCYLNPHRGGQIAVAEAARNLAACGAVPIGLSDCLNFGNPEDPEIFWQFKECVRGMAQACRALEIPVTGGNVSFYNEGEKGAVDPTPVVAMVGLIEQGSVRRAQRSGKTKTDDDTLFPMSGYFKEEGERIFLLGETFEELGGSEYLKVVHGLKQGGIPRLSLVREKALHEFLRWAISQGLLSSAHDVSEGGIAVCLAEMSLMNPISPLGLRVQFSPKRMRPDALLFGESQSRCVVATSSAQAPLLKEQARRRKISCKALGEVTGNSIVMKPFISLSLERANVGWKEAIGGALGG